MEKSVASPEATTMDLDPVAKGAKNMIFHYAHPHPGVGFRRCPEQREGDKVAICVSVDTVMHSKATFLFLARDVEFGI